MSENVSAPVTETAAQAVEAAPEAETAEAQELIEAAEAEETAEAGASEQAPKAEAKKEAPASKHRIKVDGEELELSMEDLIKHAQMGKAASKRMQEAAQLRKEAEEFIELLKKNPRAVLENEMIGVDVRKLAEDIINEQLENAAKTPEQLEKEKLQKELQALKDKYAKEEENRKQQEFKRIQEQTQVQLDTEITEAIESGKLPKSQFVVKRVADYLLTALQNNIDVSAKDVIPLVRKEMEGDLKEFFSALPEETMEAIMGQENLGRLRKYNLSKVRKAAASAAQVKPTGEAAKANKEAAPAKKISYKEFFKP